MLVVATDFETDLFGWLEERGLCLSSECAKRARVCVDGWNRHKSSLNIVSEGSLVDQVEASTAAVRALSGVNPGATILDVGAGGGFPGLWIAACDARPGWLVEPRARRADFLELMLGAMGRTDWSVVRARWEAGNWQGVGSEQRGLEGLRASAPAVVSARAVWDPERWWLHGSAMVGPEGHVLLHVRAGMPNPGTARIVKSVVLGDWEARLVTSAGAAVG